MTTGAEPSKRAQAGAALIAVVGLAVVAAALLHAGHDLIFLQDEWAFIQTRLDGSADAYLKPHNEHLLLLTVALYKALFATVGIDAYWPYRLIVVLAHLLCVVLLYLVARRSLGYRLAGFVTLPFLFIGAAWEVVLYPFNVQWCASVAALLGLMLTLDRRDRTGDILSAVLVVVALASSSLGVAIAAGVLVEVLWREDRWRRIWIPAAPALLYALWFIGYNQHPQLQGPREFPPNPRFVFDAVSGAFGAVVGLPSGDAPSGTSHDAFTKVTDALTWASALALVWVGVVRRRISARLAMLLMIAGVNWISLAVTRSFVQPWSSRYLYGGAFILVLIGLELARTHRVPGGVRVAVAVVGCAAGVVNAVWLFQNADPRREEAVLVAAQLGALEISRPLVEDSTVPLSSNPRSSGIQPRSYFDATDVLGGSPAMTPAELARAPAYAREAADLVLLGSAQEAVFATGARQRRLAAAWRSAASKSGARSSDACSVAISRQGEPGRIALRVPRRGVSVYAGPPAAATVRMSRFAARPPDVGFSAGLGRPHYLAPPRGRSAVAWRAVVTGGEIFRLEGAGVRQRIVRRSGGVAVCRPPVDQGGPGYLGRPSSEEIPVVSDHQGGFFEAVQTEGAELSVSGWSADPRYGAADRVLALEHGRAVAIRAPTIDRPDVARDLGMAARISGFELHADLGRGERRSGVQGIRVIGLFGPKAFELQPIDTH